METLFENRYTITKKRYMDWGKNSIRKNYPGMVWLAIMIIVIVIFINSGLTKDIVFTAFYALILAFCVYRVFLRPKMLLAKRFKTLAAGQGKEEWERIIKLSDHIKVTDGNTTSHYKWNQVTEFIDNKDYLILVFKNGIGIRLDKQGFTNGTYNAFLEHIKDNFKNIPLSVRK